MATIISVKPQNDFCIYVHTNKKNGKKYIGQTCQKPERRWSKGFGYKGCQRFKDAIKKYGWDGFSHEVIFWGLTAEQANSLEEEMIKKFKTFDKKFGYNLAFGGHNCHMCESAKQKISKFQKGRKCPEERKIKMSLSMKGKNNWSKGRKHTEKTKEKMREAHSKILKKIHSYCPFKPVLCLNTGKVYNSVKEAGYELGIDRTAIYKSIKFKNRKAKKLKFCFLEKGESNT